MVFMGKRRLIQRASAKLPQEGFTLRAACDSHQVTANDRQRLTQACNQLLGTMRPTLQPRKSFTYLCFDHHFPGISHIDSSRDWLT